MGASTAATSSRSETGSSRQRTSFGTPACRATTVSTRPVSFASKLNPPSGASSIAASDEGITSPGFIPAARNGASYRDTTSSGAIATSTSTFFPVPPGSAQ